MESTEIGLQRLWNRRLTGSTVYEEDVAELMLHPQYFPPAELAEDELVKSRPASPAPCAPCSLYFQQEQQQQACALKKWAHECQCEDTKKVVELDGSKLGDIPAKYHVTNIKNHEFPVIGIYVDSRVVPGFKYMVRPLSENGSKENWLFKGRALELQSIGRGYSRRITFSPDKGQLNNNPYYFWADSRPNGFAFQIQVISPGDKFTVFDANHVPAGSLEIVQNQGPEEEIGQRVLNDGSVEKTVRVRALCKVEWFEEDGGNEATVPISGVAVSVRDKKGVITRIVNARLGSHPRRGFTLTPGVSSSLRHTKVNGQSISDVPTVYTITGLEPHEFPVIGTYVDPRIIPGFYYKVRPAGSHKRRYLFKGRALRLQSLGMGYGKRITFAPDSLNNPANYFWSDSHPEGLGFEPSAVRNGMKFSIFAGEQQIGVAEVFRDDLPQIEERTFVECEDGGKSVYKYIHVEVKCQVLIDTKGCGSLDKEPHFMRVSGRAVLAKGPGQTESKLLRLENIGLESQLNVLFATQWEEELVFHPIP